MFSVAQSCQRCQPLVKRPLTYQPLSTVSRKFDIKIVEVGARDGLQNEKQMVSAENKVALIKRLRGAGCSFIESGAFVSKKMVPSMSNSLEVMKELQEWRKSEKSAGKEQLVLSCLTPNIKGFDDAVEAGADEVAIFGSASEAFSQKNINCSIDDSIKRFEQIAERAKKLEIPMRGYVSCVNGCPYQGEVSPSDVARVTEKLAALGCHEISLGDTIGIGTPGTTKRMLEAVQKAVATDMIAVHFHDTYGMACANILTSLEKGITAVDCSVAGLGGCPYAKGATGNVATEDVVYMCEGMGLETGIDLNKLIDAGEFICGVLGRETQSRVSHAILAKRNIV